MKTDTRITTENKFEAEYEASTFALGVGIAMAALVGLWGTVCLISAMVSIGPLNIVKEYFSAIIGR